MKIIDIKVGESVSIEFGEQRVDIIPQHKSGSRMRIGIEADKSVRIGNTKSLLESGLVDTSTT